MRKLKLIEHISLDGVVHVEVVEGGVDAGDDHGDALGGGEIADDLGDAAVTARVVGEQLAAGESGGALVGLEAQGEGRAVEVADDAGVAAGELGGGVGGDSGEEGRDLAGRGRRRVGGGATVHCVRQPCGGPGRLVGGRARRPEAEGDEAQCDAGDQAGHDGHDPVEAWSGASHGGAKTAPYRGRGPGGSGAT